MTAAAPSGVVTFLFTDVEGSTRRWEADPAAMRAALVMHDTVLRAAIEEHGGWLFKHTGDGVCAAFASPKSAVDAAVAAQRCEVVDRVDVVAENLPRRRRQWGEARSLGIPFQVQVEGVAQQVREVPVPGGDPGGIQVGTRPAQKSLIRITQQIQQLAKRNAAFVRRDRCHCGFLVQCAAK
jgi:hypothetical protein